MKQPKIDRFITQQHYDTLSADDAKKILDYAELQIKQTLDTSGVIVSRLSTLVTVVTAMLIGLFGYAINRADQKTFNDQLVLTAVYCLGYLYIPATLIVFNIVGKQYALPGSEPKLFFQENAFREINKGNHMKYIWCNEIQEYQVRIMANKRLNRRRWRLFNAALICILLSPIVFYLIYQFIIPRLYPL